MTIEMTEERQALIDKIVAKPFTGGPATVLARHSFMILRPPSDEHPDESTLVWNVPVLEAQSTERLIRLEHATRRGWLLPEDYGLRSHD